MNALFRAERGRILSNYAQLFGGLLIGLLVTRMLLGAGEQLFGVYITITVGMGVSIMLTELMRMGFVPVLGASVFQGKVVDIPEFRDDLFAAFVISICAAILGAGTMVLLGVWLLSDLASPALERAAWTFLWLRIAMMGAIVSLTPAMAVLLVSGRQPLFNFFLFLERLSEFAGVAIPLWLLTGANYSEADRLAQIGIGIAALTVATYLVATVAAFAPGPEFRPRLRMPRPSVIRLMLKRIGWSSLQTISMNMYVRLDVLIVAAFLGPVGTVALGVAIRLMGYVRQATIGLVNGLDATFANLHGQKRRKRGQDDEGRETSLRLLAMSTSLQGGVVFQLGVLLLMLREDIVQLWIGDLLGGAGLASSVNEIAALSSLMIIGIGFRSLNLGWMTAMTGSGNARHFTPWLLPGALGNVVILLAWAYLWPKTFSVMSVGWVFLALQAITHVFIIPIVSARSFNCKVLHLVRPLLLPLILAAVTCGVALGLKALLADLPKGWNAVGVVIAVSAGFALSLLMTLRQRPT
ncbi:MAG: hypothetical protein KKF88_05775 [Alphaproteobacteria bacterium]|nr:hypothetical protein [Alphaproteobacteria bacterium]